MEATEKTVEVGEYAINVGSAGTGDPLIMLHGSEPGESWRVWEPMMQLADVYRLVAPDLLGFGASSKQPMTPDYKAQARAMKDLAEKMDLGKVALLGGGWGGQVALEYALEWPDAVKAVVVIASSYDKEQLKRLQKLRRPTLIIYAEDDMVTQLKAGYLLRDAIGTSRLEILDPVAKDPNQDFRMSHRLQKFRAPRVVQLVKLFLSNPEAMVTEPPEMENELKGMALRKEEEGKEGTTAPSSGKP
jgi:pimeloyl-ACP methyl ester carboxylesterase